MRFTLDCKLWTSITVEADDLAGAEAKAKELSDSLDCATINAGCWKNGDPIILEASIEGDPDIYEED